MMRLIGITDAATAAAVESARVPALAGVEVAREGALAAILAPAIKSGWFDIASRATMVRRLGEDQARLEALIRLGPLLPAVEGAELDGPAEAVALLGASPDALSEALAEFGALVQFQIAIDWKPQAALAAHARDPGLAEALAASGPDRAARGAALAGFMTQMRMRLARSASDALGAAARDLVALPVSGEAGLANFVALIARPDEPQLDRTVEAIDAGAPDILTIRYIGPLPPLSFAGVEVAKSDAGEVIAARRLLGLAEDAPAASLREAYAARARAVHPDTAHGAAAGAPSLADLKAAYSLLRRVGGRTGRAPPKVTIRREGRSARRA